MMTAFRESCQTRFPASDELIDAAHLGNFADDKNLKVNCKTIASTILGINWFDYFFFCFSNVIIKIVLHKLYTGIVENGSTRKVFGRCCSKKYQFIYTTKWNERWMAEGYWDVQKCRYFVVHFQSNQFVSKFYHFIDFITPIQIVGNEITDPCERAYQLILCFAKNNDQFMMP